MENFNPYWYFSNHLSDKECDKIINHGLSQELHTAVTHGNEEKSDDNRISKGELTNSELQSQNISKENTFIRDSQVSWLSDDWVYDLIIPQVHEANRKAGWHFDIDYYEPIQFTKYNSPGGFYGWHTDGNGDWHAMYRRYIPGITQIPMKESGGLPDQYTKDPYQVGKVRKLSVTINLSLENSYEGGLLKFDFGEHANRQFHLCEEIKPRGSMIVFPSYTPHCVTPVTKGTRYSLVLWCLGRPFK